MGKLGIVFLVWGLAGCPSSEDSRPTVTAVAPAAPTAPPTAMQPVAPAPSPAAPAVAAPPDKPPEAPQLDTPTEVTDPGPFAEPPALDEWVADRVREAHSGVRQHVRIPLVFRGPFGCPCPDNYIGVDPSSMDGGEYLVIENDSGEALPEYDPSMGTVLVVDGYFAPGRKRHEDGDPEDPYFMRPFHITRVAPDQPGRRALENVRLSRLGEAEQCVVEVNDPESPLNVRARPSSRGEAVGALDHGTALTASDHRASWTRITAPVEGWVWTAGTRVVCSP